MPQSVPRLQARRRARFAGSFVCSGVREQHAKHAPAKSGAPTMAVSADDFAFLDLGKHVKPPPRVQVLADVELLVAQVVELEDHRIRLATVETWVRLEVFDQEARSLERKSFFVPPCLRYVLLAVREIVRTPIDLLAGAAVMLSLSLRAPVPGELFERFFDSASSTPAHCSSVRMDPDIRSYLQAAEWMALAALD